MKKLKITIGVFTLIYSVLYTSLACASTYDFFFPPEGRFCATPQVSAILGLAFIFAPIAGLLILISRRWALEIGALKSSVRKIINSIHLLTILVIAGNLVLAAMLSVG